LKTRQRDHIINNLMQSDIVILVPKTNLLSESEWKNLGVQQSQGWVHYMIHEPEPHFLLFQQPLPKKPKK
uniref:Cyclin-dependent kinases regulatory subunit n=1 Tax=Sarcophilus harrisii TaxID=9305 RepID=A0A7N4PAI5_SARHA